MGQSLFTGITVHSQFLGPMLSCCFAWLLCDMLLVEKKYSLLHLALLFPIPIMAFMTRSRLAFLVLAFSIAFVAFYCVPNARVVSKVRARFSNIMLVVIVLVLGAAVAFEIRGGYVSKWLRKTNDVTSDARTLGEAVTGSRQGKIDECLDDFRQNLLFGKGFQVDRTTQRRFENGSVTLFSASIEKGLLPLMVLGETGILGTIAFVVFLFIFFVTCHQRHYTATLTLFFVYLSTNLAEATFFSPSGSGGVLWIFMVVGGFVIDMNREAERLAAGDASSGEADLLHPSREPFERHLEEMGGIPLAQTAEGGEP